MKLKIDENSTNYPCTVIKIGKVYDIPEADRIKRTIIFGNDIIISSDVKEGDNMLYFVAGTQLSEDLCFNNNLYVDTENNKDVNKKGYVSHKRRLVKAIKLKNIISNGLLLPMESLLYLTTLDIRLMEGDIFTHIDGIEICKKYVVERKQSERKEGEKKPKKNKLKDLLIDNQFRFHSDTAHFARNIHKFEANTEVIITRKYHGSSLILSHVLINKKLNWFEKLINKFVKLPQSEYGFVYSSGKPKSNLPKGIEADTIDWKNGNESFYKKDIWRKAYELHKDKLEKGITIYAEIVGEGIQGTEYTYGFEHEVFVYRITQTNVDGNVYEFSCEAIKRYCEKYGLKYVDEFFVGKIQELFWYDEYINEDVILEKLKDKYLNKSYPDCKVDEGVCIRLKANDEIYKLKSPNFIAKESKELEAGVENIEDQQ